MSYLIILRPFLLPTLPQSSQPWRCLVFLACFGLFRDGCQLTVQDFFYVFPRIGPQTFPACARHHPPHFSTCSSHVGWKTHIDHQVWCDFTRTISSSLVVIYSFEGELRKEARNGNEFLLVGKVKELERRGQGRLLSPQVFRCLLVLYSDGSIIAKFSFV